jgi:hypothetical protein
VVTDEADVGNAGNIESDEAADKLPKLIRTKHRSLQLATTCGQTGKLAACP